MGQSRGSSQAGAESVRSRTNPKGSSRKEGEAEERSRSQGSGTTPPTEGRTPEGRHRRPTARAEPQGGAKVASPRDKPDGVHEARTRPREGHQLFGEGGRTEAWSEPSRSEAEPTRRARPGRKAKPRNGPEAEGAEPIPDGRTDPGGQTPKAHGPSRAARRSKGRKPEGQARRSPRSRGIAEERSPALRRGRP
jgi:hypothetical protein